MAYRRFRLPEIQIGPATLANLATVQATKPQSVAALASVAGAEPKSAPPYVQSVAGLATVAGPDPVSDGPDLADAARAQPDTGPPISPAVDLVHDLDEREGMAMEGGVPAVYARAFATLQLACPTGVSEPRWRQAISDSGLFLDE